MKKLISIFTLLAVFAFVGGAWGAAGDPKMYKIYLTASATEEASGVTKLDISGASSFILEGGGFSRSEAHRALTNYRQVGTGLAAMQLSGISGTGAQTSVCPGPGTTSYQAAGVSIYVRGAMTSAGLAEAELHPIFIDVRIESSVSDQFRTFYMPPMPNVDFRIAGNGVTAFSEVSGYLVTNLDPGQWPEPKRVFISGTTYLCNSLSGTSTLIVPDGTDLVTLAISGETVAYTGGGQTPQPALGPYLKPNDVYYLNKAQADKFQFIGQSSTVNAYIYQDNFTQGD